MDWFISILFLLLLASPVYAKISLNIDNFTPEEDYYSVDAHIEGSASDSAYYVQAMFTKPDGANYLGFTWSRNGDWFKYNSSPDPDFIKANFPLLNGSQVRKILLKPDQDDTGYTGPGEYLLKLKRYTGNSGSGEYSNTLIVQLTQATSTPEPTPTTTSTPTPTKFAESVEPTPTPTRSPTQVPTRVPTKTPTYAVTATPTQIHINKVIKTSSIATSSASISATITTKLSSAVSTTPSSAILGTESSRSNFLNKLLVILGLLIVIPASLLFFFSDRFKIF